MLIDRKANKLVLKYLKRVLVPNNVERIEVDMKEEKHSLSKEMEQLLTIRIYFKNGIKFEVSQTLFDKDVSLDVPKKDLKEIGVLNEGYSEGIFHLW